MAAVEHLAPEVGVAAACAGLGVSRASYYRAQQPQPNEPKPKAKPDRSLSQAERECVLEVLHSERFVDQSPAEVYATLLDEGRFLCSIRTMYRILAEYGEVKERRNQLRHPNYQKPELLATAPKQLWSWDITKLHGPANAMLHDDQAQTVHQHREQVLQAAYQDHPERFVRGLPLPPVLPTEVWINPPVATPQTQEKQL